MVLGFRGCRVLWLSFRALCSGPVYLVTWLYSTATAVKWSYRQGGSEFCEVWRGLEFFGRAGAFSAEVQEWGAVPAVPILNHCTLEHTQTYWSLLRLSSNPKP